ncbi:MAG TPA: DUF58 domain-containing protein [Roseiflexaceae bacterium]|nr:DUF58 domain-containing protein [Roseiflexaceae bacterium]
MADNSAVSRVVRAGGAWLDRLRDGLTQGGRLSVAQPWVLALGPLALLAGMVTAYRWIFYLGYVYLLLSAAAFLWVRLLGPRIVLQRRLRRAWAQVGDALEEEWTLSNQSYLPLLWLEIEDASTLPGYSGRRVASAGARAAQRWTTEATCTRRGVYTLGPLVARMADPLGLFRYEWRDPARQQIVIYPPQVRLPPLRIPQGQRGGLARADLLQQNITPSVGGLREYAPGDLLSHIHWPTVARTERMMVKEFDQERAGALWIVVDLSAGAYGSAGQPLPQDQSSPDLYADYRQTSALEERPAEVRTEAPLELAITLACSLAAQALSEGRLVGLLADDGRQRLVSPGRGPRQLWRIMSELVDAQAAGAQPLADVLRQGATARQSEVAGAALVVITPALEGAWLPALGAWLRGRPGGVLALLVSPAGAQAAPLAARLASSGVTAQIFEAGAPLPLLHPPRPRTTDRRSPLGKIIRG